MKILKFIETDVTQSCARAYGVRPKEIVPALIGAAAAIGTSVYGGIQSAKKNREAKAELAAQNARDNAWYQRRYNEDYADTAAGQNLIRQAKDYARQNWKKAQGASAVGGGTDAATAMAKEAGNRVVGDTVANIAAQDVARKTNVDNLHRQDEKNYTNQKVNIAQQEAQNISQVAGQTSDAMLKAGVAFDGFNSASTASNVKAGTGSNVDNADGASYGLNWKASDLFDNTWK